MSVDARLVAALQRQLIQRGEPRIGWKLGVGDAERIGDHPAVGHLTPPLKPGATYHAGAAVDLRADAEIAVRSGSYAAALEIVDLGLSATAEEIVSTNIFHRAVAFGPFGAELPRGTRASLVVNGVVRDSAAAPDNLDARLAAAAEVLAAVGERFDEGDVVITGSVVQVSIAPGDEVIADFGELGRATLAIA